MALYFLSWIALQVLTFGIVLADRPLLRVRDPSRAAKPRLAAVLVLSALLNPVALPYYFGKSRGTLLSVVAGISLFAVVLVTDSFFVAKLFEAGFQ